MNDSTTQTSNQQQGSDAGAGTQQVSDTQVNVQDILQFDPFAPPAQGTQSTADGQSEGAGGAGGPTPKAPPADQTQQQQPAQQQADQQPVQQQPGQQQPQQQQQPDQLATAITQQTEAIRAMLAQQQPQQTQQPAQQQQPQQEQPKFNLGIPDQIINAMASDDPKERSTALHAIVNGVANHVWQQTETFVKAAVQEVLQSVPKFIESHQTQMQQQRAVAEDFYGTYEVFKNAAFVPLMQNIGMQIAQEWQGQGKQVQWNAQFRDAIAERMFVLFPMLKTQHDAAVAARGKGNGSTSPKQPFRTGQGARPAPAPENEFEQVLKLP